MLDRGDARFGGSLAHRESALRHLAFGVSSTPRAAQRPAPIVIESGEAAHVTDIDGNTYVDYALGYGPLILGHTPKPVIDAVQAELARGLRTAVVHRGEAELADLIADCVPSAEKSAFVSTGSEAVQLALRTARAAAGRVPVIRFRANYHGWFDNVNLGPGDGPGTVGQDPAAFANTTVLDWGDIAAFESVIADGYAAVLLEPAAMNAGCFAPPAGYLERVRELTARHGVVLIFDEVITGFRLALGGAQARYGVTPDLSVLGKALGAGLPIGAVSGTAAAMAPLSSGKLMHRGTFNGNPLSVAAGIACVKHLRESAATLYPRMEGFAAALAAHVEAGATRHGVKIAVKQLGPALQLFAGLRRLDHLSDVGKVDRDATVAFTAELVRRGVYGLPRGLMYLSAAHTDADITATKSAIDGAFEAIAG